MKKKKKIAIILAIIIVLLAICIVGLSYITKVFSEDNPRWTQFYKEEPGSIDGIYLGSSAAYDFWMPTKAYEEKGFCIYNLGTTVQPLCIEKNIIENALASQDNIQVIVIELRNLVRIEKDDMEQYIRIVTDNLKSQTNRMEAVDTALAYYKKFDAKINYNKYGYYFPALRVVHYSDYNLSEEDWKLDPGIAIYKGYNRMKQDGVTSLSEPEEYDDYYPLNDAERDALSDLLEYCKSIDQKVIFVAAPFNPIDIDRYKLGMMNTACDMCENEGLTTLNFNREPLRSELGIDWNTDYYDRGHANIFGAQKFTAFVTDVIDNEIKLPDHRGDVKYKSWDVEAKRLNDLIEELNNGK